LGGNNWQSPHRTLFAATLTLRRLLFTFLMEELPQLRKYHWQCVALCGLCMMESPAHFTHDKKQFFGSHYPDQWLGWNGLIVWSPWSLDLTPANSCLWGHLKGMVCSKKSQYADELWCLIQGAVTTIWHMTGIFQHTRNSWHYRTQLCIQTKGDHFLIWFSNASHSR
jgi:hypothetical protein